ncbi:hypothetical protein FNZ56_00990 [Pseudoluteimonas lycopersici]|uniref:Lipoprotein n=1 Tax=Pseudoluteimonas lycopersici TaxID=1324796 RepID=A0A516V217_9GAMM|nr:hypothetical protein [Lysobacter lycopersici]QDQ72558.1 hypothetical protein FNZ56_00990 [Lysobacter lycopersici]
MRLLTTLAFLALAACTTAPASPAADANTVADGSTITLAPSQSAQLADNSRLDYIKLNGDSRCRPDVQCVWAGDATIAMRWTPANAMTAQDFVLHTNLDPKSFDANGRTITLQALERGDAPKATLQVQ